MQDNNSARASRFFVHFFAVTETSTFPRFMEDVNTKKTIFFFFSWTRMRSLRIQLYENSPAFDKLNEVV